MLSHMCVIISVGIKPLDFTVLELFYLIFVGRLFSTGVSRHLSACDGEAAATASSTSTAAPLPFPGAEEGVDWLPQTHSVAPGGQRRRRGQTSLGQFRHLQASRNLVARLISGLKAKAGRTPKWWLRVYKYFLLSHAQIYRDSTAATLGTGPRRWHCWHIYARQAAERPAASGPTSNLLRW